MHWPHKPALANADFGGGGDFVALGAHVPSSIHQPVHLLLVPSPATSFSSDTLDSTFRFHLPTSPSLGLGCSDEIRRETDRHNCHSHHQTVICTNSTLSAHQIISLIVPCNLSASLCCSTHNPPVFESGSNPPSREFPQREQQPSTINLSVSRSLCHPVG